jgi:hypothetical protein
MSLVAPHPPSSSSKGAPLTPTLVCPGRSSFVSRKSNEAIPSRNRPAQWMLVLLPGCPGGLSPDASARSWPAASQSRAFHVVVLAAS